MRQTPGGHPSSPSPAHELNNKLSIIVGNCDLIIEMMPKESPFLRQISAIRDAARSMALQIAQLRGSLGTTRPEKRKHNHGAQPPI